MSFAIHIDPLPQPLVLKANPVPMPPGPASPDRNPLRTRARLWDLNGSIHCSVVGTCLTTGELRSVMAKALGQPRTEDVSDHDLHSQAVGLCMVANTCSRLLHKALDRRHGGSVNRFARARGEEAVMALWEEFRRAGDIPGAYWAVLTHPDTGRAGIRRAFGDVHMLSHLVGAANRADIRRLTTLEEENARLVAKVERQQRRLQDLATAAPAISPAALPIPSAGTTASPDTVLAVLTRRLDEARTRLAAETSRRERAEERLRATRSERDDALGRVSAAEAQAVVLRHELDALQPGEGGGKAAPAHLPPERVLYVGGRPGTLDQLRALLVEAGGELLLHDGGQHDNPSLLPGLVSRADRVVFPVDCVSHDAALAVKRLCQQAGKPWAPLRSAGVASFLACMAVPPPGQGVLPYSECCP